MHEAKVQNLEYLKRGENFMAVQNYNRYQYETSPRKLEPETKRYPKRKNKKSSTRNLKEKQKEREALRKKEAAKKAKAIFYLVIGFVVLFAIGYRNSQINEVFSKNQKIEKEISNLKKENEQLNVAIQNSLNLSQIEKEAKERLGMQKLTSKQTIYVDLPKKDYVEGAEEEIIVTEEKKSILDKISEYIRKLF